MQKPEIGKEFAYVMAVDLDGMMTLGGMDGLNDLMDDDFHDKFGWDMILTDISYMPVGVDNDKNILLEVSGTVESTK